ncbi:ceramide-1-phosphate transfer protein [Strongylocentrotus purpuratus]|uniref:Glycolipid transfer protein domain-containing protein n=1 Tax=Strongylocentrotus purpuratus TaxID=7668 RepID=A0A7M7PD32_STRPU|nr:ceramide-1-phosphate transfer protein [Strongylocentrotus purpuratus]
MTEKMDIEVVKGCFKAAKKEDGTINIEELMRGYEEIARLYDMMGSLFTFVSKDMRYRLKALETHRSDKSLSDNYQTVQAVLDYETKNGIKRKSKKGACPEIAHSMRCTSTSSSSSRCSSHWKQATTTANARSSPARLSTRR